MIVVIEPGRFQRFGLAVIQHAQRDAGFQPFGLHGFDHGGNFGDIAILQAAPGRSHAEPVRAIFLGSARGGDHLIERHQFRGIEPGIEMG